MSIHALSFNTLLPDYHRNRGKRQTESFDDAVAHQQKNRARTEETPNPPPPVTPATQARIEQYSLTDLVARQGRDEQRVERLGVSLKQRKAMSAYQEQHFMERREEAKSLLGFDAYA